jgi:hypothetical protein
MNNKYPILMALGLATCLVSSIAASETQRGSPARAVVELFTSQGCYSCPPADELLHDLITRRPDVVALEFHVDYWDDLVYGSAGKWRDPYSDAAFTRRQRNYNGGPIGGRRGVYTPQMIVNGRRALVGSHADTLEQELKSTDRLPLDVRINTSGDFLVVQVEGHYRGPARILQVDFIDAARTPVERGENHGKFLSNHNIVTNLWHIGDWDGGPPVVELVDRAGSATGCALLVQESSGAILGAAYCPL